MQLRRFLSTPAIVLLAAALSASSHADDLEPVAPFLNEHTLAVVSIDLSQIDVATLQKQYLDPLVRTDSERIGVSVVMEQVGDWIKRFRADGDERIFLVTTTQRLEVPLPKREVDRVELDLLAQTTFFVLPKISEQAREELRKTLAGAQIRTFQGYKFYNIGPKLLEVNQATIVTFDELTDTLKSLQPAPRPEFAQALEAAGDRPVRVAVVPPPLFARAAEEILLDPLPGMKQPLGPILARGVKWVSVSVEPNLDRFSAQLVIQSADADAAKNLADVLRRAAVLVGSKLADEGEYQGLIGTALLTTLLPTAEGDRLLLSVNQERAAGLHQFFSGALQLARAGAYRNQTQNNLKQIALALLNYEDRKKHMPDRAIRDKDGKPLLSWRVAVLPYIEEGALYNEFHLDEPWDSDHNRKLIERMPATYRSPDSRHLHPGRTRYLAVVGENLAFPPDGPIQLKDFTDGTSKTITVVEADLDHAVIWTKPDDLEADLENPLRGLASGKQMFNAAFADGHVSVFSGATDPKTLRARFTRNGGEVVQE